MELMTPAKTTVAVRSEAGTRVTRILSPVEMKPSFLEPEYPFAWAGAWQLPAGNYQLRASGGHGHHHHHHDDGTHDHHAHDDAHDDHHHGDLSAMSMVMTQVEPGGDSDLKVLAEQVFVEFSASAEALSNGQPLLSADKHYQLALEGVDSFETGFSLDTHKTVAFFSAIPAKALGLKVVDVDGHEMAPVAEHSFEDGHTHDEKVSSTSINFIKFYLIIADSSLVQFF